MNNSVNKSKLVESGELSILTKKGVKRAMEEKNISLSMDEINQVSGGIVHLYIPYRQFQLPPFSYGQPAPDDFRQQLGGISAIL